MKTMRLMVLGCFGLVALTGPLWGADSAPTAPTAPSDPGSQPKDSKKNDQPKREAAPEPPPPPPPTAPSDSGSQPKDSKKNDQPKREAAPEPPPPPPAAAPPPAKPPKDSKTGPSASDPKGKSDPKAEGTKKDASPSEKPAQPVPEEPAPAPQKPEAPPPKRSLGSVILTVKLALLADAAMFPYEIEVGMDGDKAVLSGKVATEDHKRRATEIAQGIESVKEVVNKLEVDKELGPALNKRQDQAILNYVKERFARSETLKAAGFDVKVEQGVVILSGKTRFQVFALEAALAARQVPGVRAVDTTNVQLYGENKE